MTAYNNWEYTSKPPWPSVIIADEVATNFRVNLAQQSDFNHNPEEKGAWSKLAAGKAWNNIGREIFDSSAKRPLSRSLYDEKTEGTECMSSICGCNIPCIDKCLPV